VPFGVDLTDQDHGILGDHAQQRQNTENRKRCKELARLPVCCDNFE
jgi:hypothetical protein